MFRNIAYLRVTILDQDLGKNKSGILHLANDKNLGKVEFVQKKYQVKILGSSEKLLHY